MYNTEDIIKRLDAFIMESVHYDAYTDLKLAVPEDRQTELQWKSLCVGAKSTM